MSLAAFRTVEVFNRQQSVKRLALHCGDQAGVVLARVRRNHIHLVAGLLVLKQIAANLVRPAPRCPRQWQCACPVPILLPVYALTARIATSTAGTRMVDTLNARPRICSRYSRFAIRSMLRIGLASHGLDEYLFKRRLDQLEPVDGRHCRGLVQQLLRIAVRLQLDFRVAGVILRLRNLIALQKRGASFKLDNHVVALIAALDLAHLAGQHRLAVVDQANRVAQLLHLVHAMGREQNRLALVLQFQQRLLQQHRVHRDRGR